MSRLQKKFTKSEYSVQCTVSALWIHKTCSGITDEGYKFVNDQLQSTGMAYWDCRPFTSYAMNMNHRPKQVKENVERISRSVESNMASFKEGGAGQGRTEQKGGQGRGDCEGPEPVLLNVFGAPELMPRNEFRQPM